MVALPMGTASPGGAPTTPVVPLLPPPTEFSRFQKFFLSYLFYLILSPRGVDSFVSFLEFRNGCNSKV